MGRIYSGVGNGIVIQSRNNISNIFRRVKRVVKAKGMSDNMASGEAQRVASSIFLENFQVHMVSMTPLHTHRNMSYFDVKAALGIST